VESTHPPPRKSSRRPPPSALFLPLPRGHPVSHPSAVCTGPGAPPPAAPFVRRIALRAPAAPHPSASFRGQRLCRRPFPHCRVPSALPRFVSLQVSSDLRLRTIRVSADFRPSTAC